jgi:hypothetical protein
MEAAPNAIPLFGLAAPDLGLAALAWWNYQPVPSEPGQVWWTNLHFLYGDPISPSGPFVWVQCVRRGDRYFTPAQVLDRERERLAEHAWIVEPAPANVPNATSIAVPVDGEPVQMSVVSDGDRLWALSGEIDRRTAVAVAGRGVDLSTLRLRTLDDFRTQPDFDRYIAQLAVLRERLAEAARQRPEPPVPALDGRGADAHRALIHRWRANLHGGETGYDVPGVPAVDGQPPPQRYQVWREQAIREQQRLTGAGRERAADAIASMEAHAVRRWELRMGVIDLALDEIIEHTVGERVPSRAAQQAWDRAWETNRGDDPGPDWQQAWRDWTDVMARRPEHFPIEELNLTIRAYSGLKQIGVHTVRDLLEQTSAIDAARSAGRSDSVLELVDKVLAAELDLGPSLLRAWLHERPADNPAVDRTGQLWGMLFTAATPAEVAAALRSAYSAAGLVEPPLPAEKDDDYDDYDGDYEDDEDDDVEDHWSFDPATLPAHQEQPDWSFGPDNVLLYLSEPRAGDIELTPPTYRLNDTASQAYTVVLSLRYEPAPPAANPLAAALSAALSGTVYAFLQLGPVGTMVAYEAGNAVRGYATDGPVAGLPMLNLAELAPSDAVRSSLPILGQDLPGLIVQSGIRMYGYTHRHPDHFEPDPDTVFMFRVPPEDTPAAPMIT